MAWMFQQVRWRMSWARKHRDQDLWDALNDLKDGLHRKQAVIRFERKQEILHSWPEEHLHFEGSKTRSNSEDTRLMGDSLLQGWQSGIPPQRSLAWYVAQKRPVNPTMVAQVLHRCRTPFVAWEFFDWARRLPGFQHTGATCAMLFRAYFLSGYPDAAMKFFKEQVPGLCNPTEILYNVLIQGLCLAGKMQDAIDLYEEMTGVCSVPRPGRNTNLILRDGLVHNGYLSEAEELERKLDLRKEARTAKPTDFTKLRKKIWRSKFSEKELIHQCRNPEVQQQGLLKRQRRPLKKIRSFKPPRPKRREPYNEFAS